jgi:FixJ family two-component response regulator
MSLTQAFTVHLKPPSIPVMTPVVFVIDEDIAVQMSLEKMIRSEGWQPETFSSVEEFLSYPRPCVPSCLILALSPTGLEVQKRLAREYPGMPIIVISDHSDIPLVVQAMKAGAVDFMEKPMRPRDLLSTIRHGLEISQKALGAEGELRELRTSYASLTPREQQVMTLVVSGLLNKQVGGELGISEITVKAHRGQVMQKMQANSLPDLVRMASRLRLACQQIRLALPA